MAEEGIQPFNEDKIVIDYRRYKNLMDLVEKNESLQDKLKAHYKNLEDIVKALREEETFFQYTFNTKSGDLLVIMGKSEALKAMQSRQAKRISDLHKDLKDAQNTIRRKGFEIKELKEKLNKPKEPRWKEWLK
jgi:predicted  nucleic acid-binding Zn-ribbon protein